MGYKAPLWFPHWEIVVHLPGIWGDLKQITRTHTEEKGGKTQANVIYVFNF